MLRRRSFASKTSHNTSDSPQSETIKASMCDQKTQDNKSKADKKIIINDHGALIE